MGKSDILIKLILICLALAALVMFAAVAADYIQLTFSQSETAVFSENAPVTPSPTPEPTPAPTPTPEPLPDANPYRPSIAPTPAGRRFIIFSTRRLPRADRSTSSTL